MTNIKTRHGNMLDLMRGIFVHGCNARGSMGAGIALQIKNRFPRAFEVYADAHRTTGLKLGSITHAEISEDLVIVNAITQDDWRGSKSGKLLADYDAIEAAFVQTRRIAEVKSLTVNFPLIGCGLANGKWSEVAPRIERALGPQIEKVLWLLPGTEIPE